VRRTNCAFCLKKGFPDTEFDIQIETRRKLHLKPQRAGKILELRVIFIVNKILSNLTKNIIMMRTLRRYYASNVTMKKSKNIHRSNRWPDRKDLDQVFEKLSSDSVIGTTVLDTNAPLVDQIKWKLCAQIVRYHLISEISQNELAQKLNVDAPEMSRLLHYKIERYTIDRLIRYVEILYSKLSVEVRAA